MVTFLLVVSVVCSSVYALAGIATALGILRTPRPRKLADDELPSVSVIVSARNEERDLPGCIASLLALDYPKDRLEIWLVDDRSTDGTAAIIRKASEAHAHVHALETASFETTLEAKARGVSLGFKHARGQWLFVTDADGVVQPGWLRTMLGRATPEVAILAGMYLAEPTSLPGVLERATELAALPISFGVEGLGAEVVPLGPNLAIRRDVYEAQGGLESVRFRVAEDIALWQLAKRANLAVRAVLEPEALVRVQPLSGLLQLLSQQRRWLLGGFGDGPAHIRVASIGVSLWAFSGTLAIFVLLGMGDARGLFGLGLCAVSQLAGLLALRKRLQLTNALRLAPICVAYSAPLFVWLPLSAFLLPTVCWRGDGYEVRFSGPTPAARTAPATPTTGASGKS